MLENWRNIVGHEWAVEVFEAAIRYERLGHAWLITGPSQVGKSTLALTFAQAINCTSETASPCLQCRNCQLIGSGKHPDVTTIAPEISARGRASLKIEAMRNLQRKLQLAAYESRYKIAIVEDFEAASIGAANAFLKTLEEPPTNTILLLTASDADALLDTIKSRCRVVAVRPIATTTIESALVNRWQLERDDAKQLAHIANGRPGWAIEAIDNRDKLSVRMDALSLLEQLVSESVIARFKHAITLAKSPESLGQLLNTWLTWWRDLLILSHATAETTSVNPIINIDHLAQLQQLAQQWSREEIEDALRRTSDTIGHINRNVNMQLSLENLLLNYPLATVEMG